MKVPKARKLSSGTWFIQLRLNGESITVNAPTEKECTRKAQLIKARYLAEHEHNKPLPSDLTLGQMLDNYIKKKRSSVSPSTIRGYNVIRNNRLKEYMDKPLRSIKDWQALYDSEADKLSAKTLLNTWSLIKSAYKSETGQELPKIEKKPRIKQEHAFLEPAEITRFVSVVKDTKAAIPALLALHSLRASEISDLRWEDIDFEEERIFINGAAVLDEHNKLVHKKENKTDASRRYVPFLIPELKEALLLKKKSSGYIVPDLPSAVYHWIDDAYELAGVPHVGVHGLRHSFASLCYSLDVPVKVTMSIGGWKNYQTVMDIYTHLDQKNIGKHVDKLREFYAKKPGKESGNS